MKMAVAALGAAMLAGVGCGLFRDLAEASTMRGEVETFTPGADVATRGIADERIGGGQDPSLEEA